MTNACPHCGQAVPRNDGVALDDMRNDLHFAGRTVHLPKQEFILFKTLAAKAHRVIRRESLHDALYWDRVDDEPDIAVISVLIWRLRKAVAPLGIEIRGHRGLGYELILEAGNETKPSMRGAA